MCTCAATDLDAEQPINSFTSTGAQAGQHGGGGGGGGGGSALCFPRATLLAVH
jgi:hypothetical protein